MATHRVRPVYEPRTVRVVATRFRAPRSVTGASVARVADRWRVDDQWWREDPISRMYWQVELTDGRVMTVFQDLFTGSWYQQAYGAPDG